MSQCDRVADEIIQLIRTAGSLAPVEDLRKLIKATLINTYEVDRRYYQQRFANLRVYAKETKNDSLMSFINVDEEEVRKEIVNER